jgi:predicted membrane channel-forming protein YqfA (hemolysin III family)
METSCRFSKPRSTLVHTNGSVDPRFHLCGSIILLCFIYRMSQCPSSISHMATALVSLLVNLICFGTSTFCHYVLYSRKQLPSSSFLLDHLGIILHIWGTSVSVLLLEVTGSGNNNSIFLGVTLGGVVCATYLITWPREKRERVLVIGGSGALVLCSVSLYNAVFSDISRLTASYIFMALVNSIGGWFYSHGSIQVLSQRSPKPYTVSGHTLMHLSLLIASIFHASILVSSVCI